MCGNSGPMAFVIKTGAGYKPGVVFTRFDCKVFYSSESGCLFWISGKKSDPNSKHSKSLLPIHFP